MYSLCRLSGDRCMGLNGRHEAKAARLTNAEKLIDSPGLRNGLFGIRHQASVK
ncbi:hypothetical protein GDI3705 [Gluconacetobacter diazotrophicus PA1 5]|uniref:Uncharacterized protein n=1 Tax=Gluconacetobacter diazotrophicus (strain ATCC 49037 / DSM 5601 / CCUG 37298 / CIP 103539 / LMG 7603 / PAl5) TaxID=272568 RepID=A9H7J5_GLUDA|nr:hypothetical protein GDI3705 [Gluconacetobacter diazotrophicus PA1 5]